MCDAERPVSKTRLEKAETNNSTELCLQTRAAKIGTVSHRPSCRNTAHTSHKERMYRHIHRSEVAKIAVAPVGNLVSGQHVSVLEYGLQVVVRLVVDVVVLPQREVQPPRAQAARRLGPRERAGLAQCDDALAFELKTK